MHPTLWRSLEMFIAERGGRKRRESRERKGRNELEGQGRNEEMIRNEEKGLIPQDCKTKKRRKEAPKELQSGEILSERTHYDLHSAVMTSTPPLSPTFNALLRQRPKFALACATDIINTRKNTFCVCLILWYVYVPQMCLCFWSRIIFASLMLVAETGKLSWNLFDLAKWGSYGISETEKVVVFLCKSETKALNSESGQVILTSSCVLVSSISYQHC